MIVDEGMVVYAIQSGEYIKFGYTNNIKNRLIGIRTGNPHECEVVATMPGYVDEEAAVHKYLKKHRHRGEWFRNEGRVVKLVKMMQEEDAEGLKRFYNYGKYDEEKATFEEMLEKLKEA